MTTNDSFSTNRLYRAQRHASSKINKKTRCSADADNGLDAFSGQSRSTNMVPFHILHIASYCAIVTLSLRCAVFTIFVFKKFHDLEMGVKSHSRSLRVMSLKCTVIEIFNFKNAVTLKTGLGVRQGH